MDDILMIIITFIYTAAIFGLYKYSDIYANTDFNSIIPNQPSAVSRTLGILNILAETSIQTTLWGNKCCLLLLYNRLTLFNNQIMLWAMVAAYTGLSYLAIIVALYKGWCRPFSDYLVLVPGNLECLTWKHYNIMQMTLNLSTDLVLLLIPMISAILMKVAVFA
ncbi:family decarboxylase, partial [Colletotrichum tofieldiae]